MWIGGELEVFPIYQFKPITRTTSTPSVVQEAVLVEHLVEVVQEGCLHYTPEHCNL